MDAQRVGYPGSHTEGEELTRLGTDEPQSTILRERRQLQKATCYDSTYGKHPELANP